MMLRVLLLALVMTATPTAPLRAETLVATTTIRGSSPIGPRDVELVPDIVPGALTDPRDAIGMEARVNLYPGRPIRADDLQPPAVIDRNDIVTLRFNAGGVMISTDGRALDRAAEGERLRVINLISRVTVTATATAPGVARVGMRP
jgi:flagella basal body P-ring formation protein FlgA